MASGLVVASSLSLVATPPPLTFHFLHPSPSAGKHSRHGGQLCIQQLKTSDRHVGMKTLRLYILSQVY
jgi:hypothetical protein